MMLMWRWMWMWIVTLALIVSWNSGVFVQGVPPSRLECPSRPLNEYDAHGYSIEYHISLSSWHYLECFSSSFTIVASCTNADHRCEAYVPGFWPTIADDDVMTIEYEGAVSVEHDGKMTCDIVDSDSALLTSNDCFIAVYTPPGPMTCTSDLMPDSWTVSCSIDRVYPSIADCEWSFKYEDEEDFQPFPSNTKQESSNGSYILPATRGITFSNLTCSVSLAKYSFTFRPGQLVIQTRIFPRRIKSQLDRVKDAVRLNYQRILIEVPEMPYFKVMLTKNRDANWINVKESTLSLWNRKLYGLACRVPGGYPTVESTTMFCQHQNNRSLNIRRTQPGDVCLFEGREDDIGILEGMLCMCWGQHITGPTVNTSLAFTLDRPARVDHFRANGNSGKFITSPGTVINLSCTATGHPSALVSVEKITIRGSKEKKTQLAQELEFVRPSVKAECKDNGNYRCRAHNFLEGHGHTNVKELALRVKCPPTQNLGNQELLSFNVTPGRNLTFRMFATAFPIPDISDLKLEKASVQTGTWYPYGQEKYVLEMETADDVLEAVLIHFVQMSISDVGTYRLVYSHSQRNQTQSSYLDFQITEPDMPITSDSGLSQGVLIAIITSCVIALLAIIIACVIVWFYRKNHNNKSNNNINNTFSNQSMNGEQVHGSTCHANAPEAEISGTQLPNFSGQGSNLQWQSRQTTGCTEQQWPLPAVIGEKNNQGRPNTPPSQRRKVSTPQQSQRINSGGYVNNEEAIRNYNINININNNNNNNDRVSGTEYANV